MSKFAATTSFEARFSTAKKILAKYPDMVPVICEPAQVSTLDVSTYRKEKYLVERSASLGRFIVNIRSQLNLSPEIAMFIFVKGVLPPIAASMGDIYEKYKSDDGFLYLEFSGENVFGQAEPAVFDGRKVTF